MKKLMLMLCLLGVMFAMPVTYVNDSGTIQYKSLNEVPYILPKGKNFIEVVFNNAQVLSGNSLVVTVNEIAGYDKIDFYTSAVVSGSITTGSLTWRDFYGNSYGAVVITSGTGVSTFKASNAVLSFQNPKPTTNNVTMNILFK